MSERIKVRLKTDLTKYRPGLVENTEGYTVGALGMWSRTFDRFVGVHFPGIGTLDVLWKSLEIIDEEYLKLIEKRKALQVEELKTAKNVVLHRGPQGGFKYLSYEYLDSDGVKKSSTNTDKSDATRLLKIFEEYKIIIEYRIIK